MFEVRPCMYECVKTGLIMCKFYMYSDSNSFCFAFLLFFRSRCDSRSCRLMNLQTSPTPTSTGCSDLRKLAGVPQICKNKNKFLNIWTKRTKLKMFQSSNFLEFECVKFFWEPFKRKWLVMIFRARPAVPTRPRQQFPISQNKRIKIWKMAQKCWKGTTW